MVAIDSEDRWHLHIGAGSLGLGLVVPLCSKMGFKVHIANRPHGSKADVYDRLKEGRTLSLLFVDSGGCEQVPYSRFYYTDDPDLMDIFADGRLSVVTTAVRGENLDNVFPVIYEGLLTRCHSAPKNGHPLILIACESSPHCSSRLHNLVQEEAIKKNDIELLRYIKDEVGFVDTLVDRICFPPKVEQDGSITSHSETYYEWLGNKANLRGEISALADKIFLGGVPKLIRENEFDFFFKRKSWLVTGIQLAIAVKGLACDPPKERVQDVLDSPVLMSNVDKVGMVWELALQYYGEVKLFLDIQEVGYEDIKDYAQTVLTRLKRMSSDNLDRILWELGKPRIDSRARPAELLANMQKERVLLEALHQKIRNRFDEPLQYFAEYDEYCRSQGASVVDQVPQLYSALRELNRDLDKLIARRLLDTP